MPLWQRICLTLLRTHCGLLVPFFGAAVLLAAILYSDNLSVVAGVVALTGLGVFAAGFAANWLSARELSRSIDAASELVLQISQGDYERRIPVHQRQLIEPLADALDRMREQLRRRMGGLEANRDQLRTVLNSMVEGVVAVDSAQRVMLINDSAARLFRLTEAAAIGRPIWEVVRSPLIHQWVSEALSQSTPVGGEVELIAPLSRALLIRAAGLSAESTAGAVLVVNDVSELRRLESVRQEFVANASHELKTPLASIKACVETLLDGANDDPALSAKFLRMVNEQTERLDHLVQDLLALTRLESGGLKPDLRSLPLRPLILACAERHRQHAEFKNMRLLIEEPSSEVAVLADEETLEQILDNLVDNAIKYTDQGGRVTVRWWAEENTCYLEVEDTGIGIPQSQLSRIFERFYRVDRARSRELGGTGLGLSIVKHAVQSLAGKVNVNSRLGSGTKFNIELKLSNFDHPG